MDLEQITVDVGVMTEVLGVSEQFVGRLVKDGVVIKEGRGAYLLLPSVRRYIAQIKDRQRSVSVEGEERINAADELARLRQKQRELTEIKIDVERGKLVRLEDAQRVYGELVSDAKNTFMRLSQRVAPKLEGRAATEIFRLLNEEIYDALALLSEPSSLSDAGYINHIQSVVQTVEQENVELDLEEEDKDATQ